MRKPGTCRRLPQHRKRGDRKCVTSALKRHGHRCHGLDGARSRTEAHRWVLKERSRRLRPKQSFKVGTRQRLLAEPNHTQEELAALVDACHVKARLTCGTYSAARRQARAQIVHR